MTDRRTLLDVLAGAARLDGGWFAAEAVDAAGDRSYWLLSPAAVDSGPIRLPEHELPGPLPLEMRRRISRCGQPTKSGAPCRAAVARPGLTCANHRVKAGPS